MLFTAEESKTFDKEITSLTVQIKKKDSLVDKDQLTHATLDIDQLKQLPSLLKHGRIVTGANCSVSIFRKTLCETVVLDCQRPRNGTIREDKHFSWVT